MVRKLAALLALPLSACVTVPKYVAMDPPTREGLQQVQVMSVVQQDELIVVAANPGVSAAMGGGLIGALIDSEISKSSQAKIQTETDPLYTAIDDVDFRKEFWSGLGLQLKTLYPSKVKEIKTTPLVMTADERKAIVEKLAPGTAFMYISTRYTLTNDYSSMLVMTTVDLWTGGKAEAEKTPVYSNYFHYYSQPGSGASGIQAWAKDNGKQYRLAISESVAETIKMMALDLKHPRFDKQDQGLPPDVAPLSTKTPGLPSWPVAGPVLSQHGGRVVVRNTDGRLYSLPHAAGEK